MISKLGVKPKDAIDRFESGRGHRFDHLQYVDALLAMEPSVDPEIHSWHSVGGSVERGDDDAEPDFDPDELDYLERRQRKNSDRLG